MQSAKNQTRHWYWTSRKFSDRPINSITTAPPCAFSSFESSKFSKYSSGADNSWSYWWPKSYYCNFCRREFRMAQALGGHMNVHRLDRAMMKLASSSNLNHSTSLECNPNPNPNPNSSSGYSQSTSEENCSKNDLEEVSMDLKLGRESWKVGEMDYRKRKEFCVGYDIISNKKQKKTTYLMLALSCTSYEDEICKSDQVVKFGQMKVEEVDLELRLGDPPKALKQSCNVVLIK